MRPPLARCHAALRLGALRGSAPAPFIVTRRCSPNTNRWYATGIKPIRAVNDTKREELMSLWDQYHGVDGPVEISSDGECVGLIGKKRNMSKHLTFADLTLPSGEVIQICSSNERSAKAHEEFRAIQAFSPVAIRVREVEAASKGPRRTVHIESIRQLNRVSGELIVTPEVNFAPTQRHLQIRFHPELQARLRFRSWLKAVLNRELVDKGFTDVETPVLFKSTSEGAREFLVPTRMRGHAYALSQSPQQYKQILMASGISRYMQWARCFRDEDLRADRQPEFSQLDMEWAFAGVETVKKDITDLILKALEDLGRTHRYTEVRGEVVPIPFRSTNSAQEREELVAAHQFTHLTYAESIAAYGTDKPDLRIPLRIHALQDLEPYRDFIGMITHVEDPLIEAFALPTQDCAASDARKLITDVMDKLPPALAENPDGRPQVLIYDSSKPMCGFSSVGFEYERLLSTLSGGGEPLKDGDVVVFQARQRPVGQHLSGSTRIGELRGMLWRALVEAGCATAPARLGTPGSLQFVWVSEFPMFKLAEEGEPGQGSPSGAAAAHHPFTAPLSKGDLALLFTDPMQAKSAAYDLVLNGVEVGGGSVRNHVAAVQEYIMKDVLRMRQHRIRDFAHLFDALRSGCPPHAGFALGFDRLVALLSGTPTVRDVIAFPKSMKGEDLFVRSPGKLYTEQLEPYGLIMRSGRLRASMAHETGLPFT